MTLYCGKADDTGLIGTWQFSLKYTGGSLIDTMWEQDTYDITLEAIPWGMMWKYIQTSVDLWFATAVIWNVYYIQRSILSLSMIRVNAAARLLATLLSQEDRIHPSNLGTIP